MKRSLWPYGTGPAILAALGIWLAMAVLLGWVRNSLALDGTALGNLMIAGLALGLIPLALHIVDHLEGSKAVLDIKGIRLDFSQTTTYRTSIQLPDNIGRSEPVVADSSPMQIVSTLESATAHEVVRIDLGNGDSWWVTRLLALCSGAVRVGLPKVIVFVGTKEDSQGTFLGWARTSRLLDALVDSPDRHPPTGVTYGQIHRKARWLATQLGLFAEPDLPAPAITFVPQGPAVTPLQGEVERYWRHPDYRERGDAALEQIVMDLCAQYGLETPPDRLTLARLSQLFEHCLCRAHLETGRPQEEQIRNLLKGAPQYVAVVRNGAYESLLKVEALEQLVLGQLLDNR